MRRVSRRIVFVLFISVAAMSAAQAQEPSVVAAERVVFLDAAGTIAIDNARGVDPNVDYTELTRFGPWDDRNYQLTRADLDLLSTNEAEQTSLTPAFFRVLMRKHFDLPTVGPAQYPRHSLYVFRRLYGGYLINDNLYRNVKRNAGRVDVVMEDGITKDGFDRGTDTLSGERRMTSPNGAAESAVKISPANSDIVVAGVNDNGGQGMYYSSDGGDTWTKSSLPLDPAGGDPTVDWSSDGAFAYTATLATCGFFESCGVWFYRSADNGVTWESLSSITPGDPRREFGDGSDKEYMHVDQHAASPYKDNIYVTWHEGNVMQLATSTDFGNTFTVQAFPSDFANLGIGSDVTTDKNGNVYHLWPGVNNSTMRLAKSTDGGVTFAAPVSIASTQGSFDFPIPAMDTRLVFMYISAGADLSNGPFGNSIYASWTDTVGPETGSAATNHARIQVAYSRDGGSTWNVTTPHETADAMTVDRFHQWLAVGEDGTVHIVYYDTRRDPSRTFVDLFYSYSTDGAQTWSAPQRVTTEMSPKINDGFEWGDYNGADIVMNDLIAIFTDNRDESGGSAQSVDVYVAGIEPGSSAVCGNASVDPGEACDGVNVGGQTCADFACDGGVLECLSDCSAVNLAQCLGCGAGRTAGAQGLGGVPLNIDKSGADVSLTWEAGCGTIEDYAVYEGDVTDANSASSKLCSTSGATSATITPDTGNRFFLVVGSRGGVEGSYGLSSAGVERAAASTPCFPQQLAQCP